MTDLFLLVWFYLYVGLLFGMSSKAVCLYPKVSAPWQVLGWPVFLAVYLRKWLKDSDFFWFIRYCVFIAMT